MFSWGNFSKALLRDLAREKELRVTFAEEDLAVTYGSPPGSEFVDDLWPVLRDRWLDGTPASRRTVAESLRAKGLGDKSVRISDKAGQMKLLRSCRLSDSLRSIVLDEFVSAGSTDSVAVQEAAAPNDNASRAEDIQEKPLIASAVIPTDAVPDPTERQEPATEERGLLARAWAKLTGGTEDDASDHVQPDHDPDTALGSPSVVAPQPAPQSDPAVATRADAGLRAVEMLFEQLMIDDEWAIRRPRGFTWWSYRLAQHVEAGEPFEAADGAIGSVVRVWTEVARDVPQGGTAGLVDILGVANMQQSMNALAWDPESGTIQECATSTVFDDTVESWTPILGTAALLQNTAAHSRAHAVAEIAGGTPAATEHPDSGERPEMDGLLDGPAQWASEAGGGPSRFAGDHMLALGAFAERSGVMSTFDETGFTGEVPFFDDRSALELAATASGDPVGTALIQAFTDQPHPELGSGLLWVLRLPHKVDPDHAGELANRLNLVEARGGSPSKLLGAWCTPGHDLAYVSFVPSLLAHNGIMENLLIDTMVRAGWVRRVLDEES